MRMFLISAAVTAAILLPLDFLWLRTMRPFYEAQMGGLLLPQPRMLAAIAFYVVYAGGLAFFAVWPNLSGGTLLKAASLGAALGFIAYGTYDATNYATLKDFPLKVMLVDWTWGTTLSAISAGAAWLVLSKLGYTS